jgi:hypothetical protein
MKFNSWLVDKKILGINVSIDMTIGEYMDFASDILESNELQRKRVRSKGKVYELLRKDLLEGCVMPPIILAVTEEFGESFQHEISNCIDKGCVPENESENFKTFITTAIEQKELIILDGLQRTYTLEQCLEDSKAEGRQNSFKNLVLRTEVFLGLKKLGILYRMLTLNTGQTPMTFRHQIEILYHDYLDKDSLPDEIKVKREIEGNLSKEMGNYKYQDVVDMFYAFSTGSPKSFDKQALVSQLKEIDFLQDYQPDQDELLDLLRAYNKLISRINELSEGWEIGKTEEEENYVSVEKPFGSNVPSVFNRVQAMAGFGAECKRLIKQGKISKISDVENLIRECKFTEDPQEALNQLIQILDQIADRARKIGDEQRAYFQICFRQLLNDETDTFQNLSNCWLAAQETFSVLY